MKFLSNIIHRGVTTVPEITSLFINRILVADIVKSGRFCIKPSTVAIICSIPCAGASIVGEWNQQSSTKYLVNNWRSCSISPLLINWYNRTGTRSSSTSVLEWVTVSVSVSVPSVILEDDVTHDTPSSSSLLTATVIRSPIRLDMFWQ